MPLTSKVNIIEVYPAATMRAYGWIRGTEKFEVPPHHSKIQFLKHQGIKFVEDISARTTEHAVDAAICVVAGVDFIRGNAIAPKESELHQAMAEGWIWVKRKSHT